MKKVLFFSLLALMLASCTQQQAKVYGRYVPERKDDFAWENEYAAFRMYGPALKPENPSNGVDLWLKNNPALVVDTMYGRELKDMRPYHINYDGNLDCYKVAHTAGAGGLVVIADGETYVGGPYDRWEIVEQTPERFVFRLEYDSLLVAGHILTETLTITAEAGAMFNKAEVVLRDKDEQINGELPQLLVGGGIFMHDTVERYEIMRELCAVAYAEDALSDKQAARMNYEYNGSTTQGRSYLAVFTPGATLMGIHDGNQVAVAPYKLGETLTYWFGACWSEWSNGDEAFPTDEDWFEAVKDECLKLSD